MATAKGKVRIDLAAIDTITLTNLETNPDFDGATDAATQSDRTKLATDQGSVATALAAVNEGDIAAWEVLIPAPVLTLVVAVVEAETTLARSGRGQRGHRPDRPADGGRELRRRPRGPVDLPALARPC